MNQTNASKQPGTSINCVEMKRLIQEELRAKWGNIPWSERNGLVRAAAATDAHLSRHVHPHERQGATGPALPTSSSA